MLNEGIINKIYDSVVEVLGLKNAKYGEMILFSKNIKGIVFSLNKKNVNIIILNNYNELTQGEKCYCTNKIFEVPVGKQLIGRIINSRGETLDLLPEIKINEFSPIEKIAPGVMDRETVNEPLLTGIKSIDSMIPIGKGQRELIIGDRQTGKTTICIDTIINQKNKNIICVYVCIGQKISSLINIINKLKKFNCLEYTIIVASTASDSAAEQYIAPYTGSTISEYFRDKGQDCLIVYDDLTKHAWAYRQISLLLRRPPGREAYPGDVFYLHSRLLERSSKVNKFFVNKKSNILKAGSLTAFPIIETLEGDVTSFIPTNVISITDGQIFLDTNLFNSGIRPSINVGLSVSRVGGAAQYKIIKKLSGDIRIMLAQYRELEAFSKFSSDLDSETKNQLIIGEKITILMKQNIHDVYDIFELILILLIIKHDFFRLIPINQVEYFENKIINYLRKIKFKNQIEIDNKNLENCLNELISFFISNSIL
ncbi:F0F1-type ATP synthase alpha subunit [Candidatus Carsonella ruddii PV]|uniref:ATP synthase subunit alpha n=2 Tax=Carsonella ruddii TaxID=114186 RepID=ATPA_CARRP|nr:F0F1 ATP synthase subunit alpha [Candidatus Carsonella ruddii]Q05FY3.1 RecName: Full=ATP synthase subunit alpha; AltName: Full=ATP synthase F1 sector subunit alpha; AltName: Full=F-ATPase subunit alpha [Candidatus Carsonella ruddii PV]AAK17109.1 ATP synthase alpha subunit [Candidatus Carsonella ruddii]BAF35038.1 F0F1-type ATP synthase alpha subunit [Candidatus Carsonella ruddii PV]